MQFVLILRNEKVQLMEFRSIACNVLQIGDSWLFSSQFCQCAVMLVRWLVRRAVKYFKLIISDGKIYTNNAR